MMDAIDIAGLEKTYAKGILRQPVMAVRGISLRVASGEAFGFVGPNGAGKSSTIRILMGLARPTAGTVRLFGENATRPEARRGVGYVPENPCLYDYLTPLEILEMALRLHRTAVDNRRSWAMQWLERLGLATVVGSPVRSFSKGMTQRVAIALAMCIKPRLLVLDEPLSGLDPIGRHEVVDLLAEYKRSGGTLFFTSHVLHDVERLADRYGLIHEGTLRSVRSPTELVGTEDLVIVRSKGDTLLAGWQLETSGQWLLETPRDQLWQRLEQMREAGHMLIEVKPTLSLESAFMHAVGRQKG
jgi:ABC-2 type transport system ATP-binding protein